MKFILYHPVYFEQWDYRAAERGIGGSETNQIEMAWRLARRGHEVISYAPIPDDCEPMWRGTEWRHIDNVDFTEDGIWIIYRAPQSADYFEPSENREFWLMCQDEDYPQFSEERAEKFKKVMPLCQAHADNLVITKPYLAEKIWITSNGVKIDLLRDTKPQERNPYRIMYASSPDRGLLNLLKIFKHAKEFVPQLELHTFYGFNNIDKMIDNPQCAYLKDSKDKILNLLDQKDVYWHGRVPQPQLYEEWLKSGLWVYPTNFRETSCHPAGTRIATDDGDIPIEMLNITAHVLTHTGQFRDIKKLMKRKYVGNMIKLKVQSGDDLELTPEHPVLVTRGKDTWHSFEAIKNNTPFWVEAKDVQVEDCLLYPRYISPKIDMEMPIWKGVRRSNLGTEQLVNYDNIIIDNDLSWWLGYFCGDGSASDRTGKVNVFLSKRHLCHKEKILQGMSKFGLEIKEREYNGFYELYFHSYRIAKTLRKYCYINKEKLLPIYAKNQFGLEGLLAADGHLCGKNQSFTSISLRLIGQVRQLLSEQGLSCRAIKRVHEHGQDSYTLGWTINPSTLFYGVTDKYLLTKVKKISEIEYDDWVYNLEVDQDNTYVSNGHIVHNCITCLESQSLGAIPITNPWWALAENVRFGMFIQGDCDDRLIRARYVGEIVRLTTHPELQESIRQQMMNNSQVITNWERIVDQWEAAIYGFEDRFYVCQYIFQLKNSKGKILNIGCNTDVARFRENGATNLDFYEKDPYTGVENTNVDIFADARNLPETLYNQFDTAILGDILEHFMETEQLLILENAKRALIKDGRIVITCPDDRRGIEHEIKEGYNKHRPMPKEYLEKLLQDSGLNIELYQEIDYGFSMGHGIVCEVKK